MVNYRHYICPQTSEQRQYSFMFDKNDYTAHRELSRRICGSLVHLHSPQESDGFRDENIDALRRMIETDRHVTYHEIRASFDIGMRQIRCHPTHTFGCEKAVLAVYSYHSKPKQQSTVWVLEMIRNQPVMRERKVIDELRKNNRKSRIILHHDNASSHTAKMATTGKFLKEKNVELMSNPAYNLDLAPWRHVRRAGPHVHRLRPRTTASPRRTPSCSSWKITENKDTTQWFIQPDVIIQRAHRDETAEIFIVINKALNFTTTGGVTRWASA
ncbi:hypothetical protein EVAR_37230_1 [Eumeta japonica]|uniref:Mariner Mos1 transposase n=1 Tax=Eumeta variegata TaxID=151549 RepID=A0A4C1Y9L2_EUMVA|nr:hypothetical protein EVAR_37230_1 [Eumeta japonica]